MSERPFSSSPLHHPDYHTQEESPPFYRQPIFIGMMLFSGLFAIALWAYSQNTEWLEATDDTNEQVERILAANPDLSREDLEKDIQAGDLDFWLRTDPSNTLTPLTQPNSGDSEETPSLLDQYMQNKDEQNNQTQSETTNNPLLNLPNPFLLENVNQNDNASDEQQETNTRPPSALDMFLNPNQQTQANTPANPLTQALNRMSQSSANREAAETEESESQISTEENNPANSANNATNNQLTNNPLMNNGQPLVNPNQPQTMPSQNNPYGTLNAPRQSTNNYFTPTQNPRRYPNAATTPNATVAPTNPRQPTVSPRFQPPSTNPYGNNSSVGNTTTTTQPNYNRRQGANQQAPGVGNQPRNSQNIPRMGGGQINTFSDPFGTSGN
ncbi:MAG: hypothetical protein F6K03_07940 [Kamptonema sp. SIO4C4]|nr:hypothetical protein [Kamptonema sp. SIO4C4]